MAIEDFFFTKLNFIPNETRCELYNSSCYLLLAALEFGRNLSTIAYTKLKSLCEMIKLSGGYMRLLRFIQKEFSFCPALWRYTRIRIRKMTIVADHGMTKPPTQNYRKWMDPIDIHYIERALYFFFWQCLYILLVLFSSWTQSYVALPPSNTFTRLSYSKVTLLLLWDIFTLSNVVLFPAHQRLPLYRKITCYVFIVPNRTESWHRRYLPQRSCCYYTLFLFMNLYEHAFLLHY